jgi:hypothetical protein
MAPRCPAKAPAQGVLKKESGRIAQGPTGTGVYGSRKSLGRTYHSSGGRLPVFAVLVTAVICDALIARDLDLVWVNGEAESFLKWDWAGGITLNRFNKFRFVRKD